MIPRSETIITLLTSETDMNKEDHLWLIVMSILVTAIASGIWAIMSWGERTYTVEYFECHHEYSNPFEQLRCVDSLPNKGLRR